MQIPLLITKILKLEFEKLLSSKKWLGLLLDGQFYEFEKLLHAGMGSLYDVICKFLIEFVSQTNDFVEIQKALAKQLGLRQLIKRRASIQAQKKCFYHKECTKFHKENLEHSEKKKKFRVKQTTHNNKLHYLNSAIQIN